MAYRRGTELATSPTVEWFAEQIPNPVLRLRFLRGFRPQLVERQPRPKSRKFWLLASLPAALLLFTTPPSKQVMRAPAEIPPPAAVEPAPIQVTQPAEIWLVERTAAYETYSNGLRIDNRFAVATHARSYVAFPIAKPESRGERRSLPAGIVFHTTESPQAPFEASENSRLKRIGESLLEYVRSRQSYNFVIDRFGRVYRIVPESDAANHAGYSVWGDAEWLYLNLNESFLGVSFETQTLPGRTESTVSPAQVESAALLTAMLRRRYGIRAENCVTHAQVSVNASSLRIGYHLDWASSFPFAELGLPDNYAAPLPAVSLFGFKYDENFARRAGERLHREAETAERIIEDRAAGAHMSVAAYRKALQKRYQLDLAAEHEARK